MDSIGIIQLSVDGDIPVKFLGCIERVANRDTMKIEKEYFLLFPDEDNDIGDDSLGRAVRWDFNEKAIEVSFNGTRCGKGRLVIGTAGCPVWVMRVIPGA